MVKKCMIALAVVVLIVSVVSAADPAIQAIDLCKFPVYIDVGYYVQLPEYNNCMFPVYTDAGYYVEIKDCNLRKLNLVQVDCESIGRDGGDFPCYKGSDVIQVKANFPAIFNASLNKNSGDEDKLKNVNLYWENGVNTIKGCAGWEELKLCLEVWNVDLHKTAVGTVEVGEITIGVRPPDDSQSED